MTVSSIKRTSFVNDRAEARRRQYEMEGRTVIDTNISHEAHLSLGNKGKWPEGAVWLFMTGEVFGPAQKKQRYAE